jgi:hypothetical protein
MIEAAGQIELDFSGVVAVDVSNALADNRLGHFGTGLPRHRVARANGQKNDEWC